MTEDYLFDQFVKSYSKLIYTAVEKRLRGSGFYLPREEVMDIQQEVLASLWESRKLDNIRNAASIPYWLAIVSGNAAMQHMRSRRRIEPQKRVSMQDKIGPDTLAELIPSSWLTPSEELDRCELSDRLDKAIESLSANEKVAIKLNLLYDKKYEEISDILRIPTGTVSIRIKRAKEKLRAHLEESE